jgi:hypothetical protein
MTSVGVVTVTSFIKAHKQSDTLIRPVTLMADLLSTLTPALRASAD